MPINSKNKGNRVERDAAKIFSERFGETFRRVPSSGAHGTNLSNINIREDAKEILTGDLIVPKKFRFVIEVKSRADFNFWDLINRDTINEIDDWISQAEREAFTANKKMLIIIKINNKKMFAVYKKEDISTFIDTDLVYKNKYVFTRLDYFLELDDNYFMYKEGVLNK
jgi:Holliday junction resolvase